MTLTSLPRVAGKSAINSPLTIFVFTPLTAGFAGGVGLRGQMRGFVGVFSSWAGGLTAAA
ncbi:hypothetical protein BRAS3843_70020 [Bradyrhizobium sp. STM 3843]|uniref:hypothetical protein n=1 Tax=Bradyrhizobium sp. STM 3843 TaxID=551947 RepID=UPI0002403895|nr:hypothetical protein [Bradyrhizobium sp. STM 3843]CCE11486.1 hypothetical protein BRAS3843_70020 [Bradyrhizobium sp. STM 3843]